MIVFDTTPEELIAMYMNGESTFAVVNELEEECMHHHECVCLGGWEHNHSYFSTTM